jgi:hypothetical protein
LKKDIKLGIFKSENKLKFEKKEEHQYEQILKWKKISAEKEGFADNFFN